MEKNPSKFRISVEELRSRRHFLHEMKTIVKNVKDQLCHPSELLNGNHKNIDFSVATATKPSSGVVNNIGTKNPPSFP